MIEYVLSALRAACSVNERDIGECRLVRDNGMEYEIRAYGLEGIGNLSVIRMNGMNGMMKMDTVVLTPLEKDAPMFSFDRIRAMGNDTLLMELYDTCLAPCGVGAVQSVTDSAAALPDCDLGVHWYDSLKLPPSLAKKAPMPAEGFDALERSYFDAYLRCLSAAPGCKAEDKRAKTAVYVDGLFENGGPATDNWKRILGAEAAKEMFSRYIFASKE